MNRREQREELQSTWHVYDAARPLRAEDMAAPPQPETATPAAEASPAPRGGALAFTTAYEKWLADK